MLKIMIYTDGSPESEKALGFGAELKKRLGAGMAVLTIRSGTHATDEPPPVGVESSVEDRSVFPAGIRNLMGAADFLTVRGFLIPQTAIRIRDLANGHLFVRETPAGERIPFYERFGHAVEVLNREIEAGRHDLLVIAVPLRKRLHRFLSGNAARKLALDLHASVLVVRGGGPDSRYLLCADGSPSAMGQFPFIRNLLPAISDPLNLAWVRRPDDDEADIRNAETCLSHAERWLETSGKKSRIIRLSGDRPEEAILEEAGEDAVIVMGESMRHDVYRRTVGSFPMRVLANTWASVLLVKHPSGAGPDFFKDPFCH